MLRTVRGIRRTGPDTTFAQGDWCGAQAEYVRGCAVVAQEQQSQSGQAGKRVGCGYGRLRLPTLSCRAIIR